MFLGVQDRVAEEHPRHAWLAPLNRDESDGNSRSATDARAKRENSCDESYATATAGRQKSASVVRMLKGRRRGKGSWITVVSGGGGMKETGE